MRIKILIAFLIILVGSAIWYIATSKSKEINCFEYYCENKGLLTSKNCSNLECLKRTKKRTCDGQSGFFDYFSYQSGDTTVEIPICRLDEQTFVEWAILKDNHTKSH